MTDSDVESPPDYSAPRFTDSSEPRCAYLLSEVSIFNNRVIWYLEQQQKQEIFALASTGALWAYLLKENGDSISYFVALVPPIITAALYAKSLVMTKAMGESMDYLEKLEESFDLGNNLGWVHYYKSNTSNYKRKWRNYFWKGLLVVNIIICCLFLYSGYPKNSNEKDDSVTSAPKENVLNKKNIPISSPNINMNKLDENQATAEGSQ